MSKSMIKVKVKHLIIMMKVKRGEGKSHRERGRGTVGRGGDLRGAWAGQGGRGRGIQAC